MTTIDQTFACSRCGLTPDGSKFTHLSNCPSHGSSDCPVTMGYEEGIECDECRSERWYDELREILSYRGQ